MPYQGDVYKGGEGFSRDMRDDLTVHIFCYVLFHLHDTRIALQGAREAFVKKQYRRVCVIRMWTGPAPL